MMTVNPKTRAAVLDGIAKGWSAKHTALEHGMTESNLRVVAKKMKLSFPWQRLGMPPKGGSERIALKTLFGHNRVTSEYAMTQLRKALRQMDSRSPAAVQVAKVINFLHKRRSPPHWERRVIITR